jgi:hypothetical protein
VANLSQGLAEGRVGEVIRETIAAMNRNANRARRQKLALYFHGFACESVYP